MPPRSVASIAGPRWERRPDDRPRTLMASALKLLMRRGYRRIRVEDVARDAGVSKATVYHYFSNKDDLLTRTVAGRIADKQADVERRMASAGGTASNRLRLFLQQLWLMSLTPAGRPLAAAARQRNRDGSAGRLRRLGARPRAAVAPRRGAHQGRTANRRIPPRRGREGRRADDRVGALAPGVVSRALGRAALCPVRRRPTLRLGPRTASARPSRACLSRNTAVTACHILVAASSSRRSSP